MSRSPRSKTRFIRHQKRHSLLTYSWNPLSSFVIYGILRLPPINACSRPILRNAIHANENNLGRFRRDFSKCRYYIWIMRSFLIDYNYQIAKSRVAQIIGSSGISGTWFQRQWFLGQGVGLGYENYAWIQAWLRLDSAVGSTTCACWWQLWSYWQLQIYLRNR